MIPWYILSTVGSMLYESSTTWGGSGDQIQHLIQVAHFHFHYTVVCTAHMYAYKQNTAYCSDYHISIYVYMKEIIRTVL